MAKKTWIEKLNSDKAPQLKVIDKAFADIPAGGSMLIATPKLIEEHLREIPEGHQTTIKALRNDLAIKNNAEYTCPVTTGIFLRTVAEAANELREKGTPVDQLPPFWRAINENSNLVHKLSFGTDFLIQMRKKEGLI